MEDNNCRLEGLKREAKEVAKYLKSNVGLLGCDLEIIGALLFTKYKGEDKRIEKMIKDSSNLREEAQKFLDSLKQ